MSSFKADFTVYPTDHNLLAAPVNVEFKNTSILAAAIQNDYTFAVDSTDTIYTPSKPLYEYPITKIDKVRWDFGDKSYASDYSVNKVFNFPGTFSVTLSIYSEELYDGDVIFYIKSVKTIDVKVESRILAWLKLHMTQPHLEAMETNQAFKDMISGTSQMFDRMYKEINQVANLMDIKKVAPKFLEYFSDTFNHKKFYSKKVGYSKQLDNDNKELFLDYDIFNRIERGVAEEPELELFRQFIIDTAALFKQNGSKHGMEEFFKLYDFIIHVGEKWTRNFGVTEKEALIDDFLIDSSLKETKNDFKFKGLSIVGFDNSVVQLRSGFNSLILDNYHYISQITYPSDVAFSGICNQTFEINDYPPNILGMFRSDGRLVTSMSTCFGLNLNTNCTSATSGTSGTSGNPGTSGTSGTSGNPSTSGTSATICANDVQNDIIFTKNNDWDGAAKVIKEKISYKQWQGPQGYVNTIITNYGTMPSGVDEIAETGTNGITTDDYLWADWNYGVTVPVGLPGVTISSMKKPVLETEVPNIRWASTDTNYNLIQSSDFTVSTKQDFFIATRGFIHVTQAGYYVFSLETGNTGVGDNTQQIALFSLKHNKNYTLSEIEVMESLDDITFTRDNTDVVETIGTTATGTFNLYSKKGEYGIIEIRQNEAQSDSGYYKLDPGYYAFEVKASFSSATEKKLKLYWHAYQAQVGNTVVLDNFIQKKIIPKNNFITLRTNDLTIEDSKGKGYVIVPNSLIEGGDIFNIVYRSSATSINQLSGIISTGTKTVKNFELLTRVTTEGIRDIEEYNTISPQKTFMIVFGATYKKKDLYSNIDDYYALVVNGKRGEISLIHVTYSDELDGPAVHRLNLNPVLTEKDNQQYSITLLDSDGHSLEIIDGVYYDFLIKNIDGNVSVYYKKNTKFTDAVNNVANLVTQDVTKYVDDEEFIEIFKDISLNQSDSDVETTDWNGNGLSVAVKYKYDSSDYGYYGFAVKSSIIKLEKFIMKSYDMIDESLLSTEEKWKTVKPKFLDCRDNGLLKYNSYGLKNKEHALPPAFSMEITSSYNNLTSIIPIDNSIQFVSDNSVQSVMMSNISASSWGTRFNVVLNKDWVESHFENASEIMNSVIVPYGNFQQPYINWLQPFQNASEYTNYIQAGYYPNLAENTQVLPHVVAISGGNKIYLTDLTRDTTDKSILNLDSPLNIMLNATNNVTFNGLWEEVCPLSVAENWVGTKYPNEVFEPIYKDKNSKTEVIGAKFKNQKIIETLICRYCDNATVWGLYELTFPTHMTENVPEYNADTINPASVSPMRYFAPIGTLNVNNLFLLPPVEMVKSTNVTMKLLGVYCHLDVDAFSLITKQSYKLTKFNTFEENYKFKIKCNYFLDISTSFFGKFETFNNRQLLDIGTSNTDACYNDQTTNFSSDSECINVPNAFYMPTHIRNILNYLTNNSSNLELDYLWWNPKTLWIKKQTTSVYSDDSENIIYSGLNGSNKFYSSVASVSGGFELINNESYPYDTGRYVADVRWCVSNVGWDSAFAIKSNNENGVGTFETSAYANIGFTGSGKMGFESLVQVGDYLTATIPLDTISVSGKESLHFGKVIEDSTGIAKTISPYGLFNWFQAHSNPIYDTTSTTLRVGWENGEWNSQFNKCFKIENVYAEVSQEAFHINKYWAFYADNIPTLSSVVSIGISNYKCAEIPENVLDSKMVMGVSDGSNGFFNVPPIYSYYPKWIRCINGVYVDNYELPSDSYYVSSDVNTGKSFVVLDTQGTTFDYSKVLSKSTSLIVNFYSENLISSERSVEEKLVDDFKSKREINWVTFTEQDSFYKIAMRNADDTLLFTGSSEPFNIIEYKGEKVYQLSDKFKFSNSNSFSGEATDNETVGVNSDSGSIDVMQIVDLAANNYTLSTDVIFDSTIIAQDYQKRFELILKAETGNIATGDWAITDYYFVGIGVYDFDIGLGMRSVDPNTKEIKETYLASFGEFNVRNIKADTWYTLKATVSSTNIKIYFHERGMDPQLVLNYNIDKKYEKLSERYLKGQYETLEAIVTGLQELMITYPDKLGNTTSAKYTYDNFKEEFAKTLPINGNYCGFRTYNPYTYVANVNYSSNVPKQYKWGSTLDVSSKNDILEEIKRDWGMPINPEIKKYKKTLNYTTYVLINDTLFYKEKRGFVQKYPRPVYDFDTNENKIFVIEKLLPTDAGLGLNEFTPGEHSFVWSLSSNVHNISAAADFYKTVPNLLSVKVNKSGIEHELALSGETSGTSATCTTGTSATSGTGFMGSNVKIDLNDIITLKTGCRTVIWPLDGIVARHDIMLRVYEEGFVKEYTILIKDKTFYKDEIKSYMNYSQKKLQKVIINDNRLHLIFEDI